MHTIIFTKEENTHMKDLNETTRDPDEGMGETLKIIFEGLGKLAETMPDEISYIFLPKLKDLIMTEKG